MKFRFSFSLKILLPYLLIAMLFLVIFISERNSGRLLLTLVSVSGMVISLLFGVLHLYWFRRPLHRIKNIVVQLTRGTLPAFTASKSTDEIGEVERNLEKLFGTLRVLTRFARSMASGAFSRVDEGAGCVY